LHGSRADRKKKPPGLTATVVSSVFGSRNGARPISGSGVTRPRAPLSIPALSLAIHPWRSSIRPLSLLVLLLIFAPAVEAAEPKSVLDLFNRLPDPPASAQDAVKWFDQNGKLIHPGLLGEVDRLIDQTETAAKRAADIVNGGVERLFIGLQR
jgi:hypothetical protein